MAGLAGQGNAGGRGTAWRVRERWVRDVFRLGRITLWRGMQGVVPRS